jgi:hypothetical protein
MSTGSQEKIMRRLLFLLLFPALAWGQSYPSPTFNTVSTPTTFNLRCGGVNDQAALAAAIANGGTSGSYSVLKLSGTCVINATINLTATNSGLTIVGEDANNTLIKAAAASNISSMFNATASISNFRVSNATFDANYSAQTVGNQSTIFEFAGVNGYSNIEISGNQFLNCGGTGALQYGTGTACIEVVPNTATTAPAYNIRIRDNYFSHATYSQINMGNVQAVQIDRNVFFDYSTNLGTYAAVHLFTENGVSAVSAIQVNDNIFRPLSSVEFAFEISNFYAPAYGVNFVGNNCYDVNAAGGCGFSGAADLSTFSGNVVYNGNNLVDGFEVDGNYTTVCNNTVYNGQFDLSGNVAVYGTAGPYGMTVCNNTVSQTGTGNSFIPPFAMRNLQHSDIFGNEITVKYSGTTNVNPLVWIGWYGSAGPIDSITFRGNRIVDLSTTTIAVCISMAATASTHVTIQDNTCVGNNGIQLASSSTNTDLTVVGNDLSRSTGSKLFGSPTGSNLIVGWNKLGNGDFWYQPGGTPTISSGFGTTPSVVKGKNPASFTVNVGTGGAATSGVIAFPWPATNGWVCSSNDGKTFQSASTTTTATVNVAVAWAASTVVGFQCAAY